MDLGQIQAERGDRGQADRADDSVGLLGQRVEGAGDLVVVQRIRGDVEDLLDGPRRRPVGDADHRGRTAQPVGDQDLDDLAMGQTGDVLADRAKPVDGGGDAEAAQEVTDDRQRAEYLLHARRAVILRDRHRQEPRQAHHSTTR